MGKKDPRVDAYIDKAGDFAKPVLKHLRALVHAHCPGVEETMKWSSPFFMHHGILCNFAAFKAHCSFNFWKGGLVVPGGQLPGVADAMGQFGRITKLEDLPADKVIAGYIKKAMALNEEGVKAPERTKPNAKAKKELAVPDYVTAALKNSQKALAAFEAFSYSHRKEYVEWITEAKTAPTRERRIATMLKWLVEGKSRNWKYEQC